MVECMRCGREMGRDECYEYQGTTYCEDCYMDIFSPPKACDPWAVHSAQTFLKGRDKLSTLTSLQLDIVNYVKAKGEASAEQIMKNCDLTEEELNREFAVLRHIEILRASKKGDEIFYALF